MLCGTTRRSTTFLSEQALSRFDSTGCKASWIGSLDIELSNYTAPAPELVCDNCVSQPARSMQLSHGYRTAVSYNSLAGYPHEVGNSKEQRAAGIATSQVSPLR